MPPLLYGSLCSGYGGLDLAAAEVFGAAPAWHAQYEPPDRQGKPDTRQHAAAILAHHWPDVPNHGDIAAIDYAQVDPVDILLAGWPCQDMSLAGLRRGMMPGTRSGLWAHVARAIRELRPSLVLLENVRSITSARAHSDLELCPWCLGDDRNGHLRALGCVLGDLADLGFDAEWLCLRASDVGAPHERARVFILAWPTAQDPDLEPRQERRIAAPGQAQSRRPRPDPRGRGGAPAADARRDPRPQDHPHEPSPAGRGRGLGEWDLTAYGPAVRTWERILGRPAPRATNARGRLNPAFPEWMMGLPAGWVTAVPDIPDSAQLHALGNGVVPQQAAAAYRELARRALTGHAAPRIQTGACDDP